MFKVQLGSHFVALGRTLFVHPTKQDHKFNPPAQPVETDIIRFWARFSLTNYNFLKMVPKS